MWSVKKIFNYDYETGNVYVLLVRNSKPTKNKNTDLLRSWVIKTYPDVCKTKKDIPEVLKNKKLGRLTSWINGTSQSKMFEDVVMGLMEEAGQKIKLREQPPEETSIIARGWLPSVLPVVSYDLKLKKCKGTMNNKTILKLLGIGEPSASIYRITGVDWIEVGKLDGIKLIPFIDWFADKAASNHKKRCRETKNGVTKTVSLKAFIKSRWRKADWSIITRENYKKKILNLVSDNVQDFLLYVSSYKPYLLRIFQSYFDLPLKLMPWVKFNWLQIKIPRTMSRVEIDKLYVEKNMEIRNKWNRLATNPENILLQGEDFLYDMDINDFKRLYLCLQRDLPEDEYLDELEDANLFIKSLYNKTCLPITGKRTSSTKYVHKIGNNWATTYDIEQTKKILDWLEEVPVYVNKNINGDIPFDIQVVLKHPDDKMHWWSNYSYANVSLERTEDRYIIGNAHNFTHDDWIRFTEGPKPLAIVGRCDILGQGRGNVFYDYATHRRKITLFDSYPICENIEKVSYEDARTRVWMDAQVYVSCKQDKETYIKFPPATKLKRKWMFNPKRIVTEELNDGVNIWVKESGSQYPDSGQVSNPSTKWITETSGSETAVFHSILKSAYSDANVICTWESYQMVDTAILICTTKTTPLDVHRVKSYARKQVILVEVQPAPIMQYKVKSEASLINIQ